MPKISCFLACWSLLGCFALVIVTAGQDKPAAGPKGEWVTRGFESFIQGTFDNAGQNLYVSRAGVLQRIHQFDLNHDGYLDIVFCNGHGNSERPPTFVYADVLGQVKRTELPADGPRSGAVADLNCDGYDDLVLANTSNGTRDDLNAFIYYGGEEGLGERFMTQVPAPGATSVAIGDFNGDGRADLAFRISGKTRLFYHTELGFEVKRFTDLELTGDELAGADLDGDGFADLYALTTKGQGWVYWGGGEGSDPGRRSEVKIDPALYQSTREPPEKGRRLAKVLLLKGVPHLFVAQEQCVLLVPVRKDRSFGAPIVLRAPSVLSASAGDVNGDGHMDVVLASRSECQGRQCSWVYWGARSGFDEARRAPFPTSEANDVEVGDLNADGFADVVISQELVAGSDTYSSHSSVYRGDAQGMDPNPVSLPSDFAQRVFITKTSPLKTPEVILVNQQAGGRSRGDEDSFVYYGGPEGFSPQRRADLVAYGSVGAVLADLNDDGLVDVVLANAAENPYRDPGSYVLYGRKEGFRHEPSLVVPVSHGHGVCAADLNRDGYLDLIFIGYANPDLLICYGGPEGFRPTNFQRIRMEIDGKVYDDPRWPYLVDLNRDGWLDLVVPQVSYDRSFILWGGPDGFNMARRQMLSVWHGSFAQAADLDGNGWVDLIMGGHIPSREAPHDSFAYVYWNGPNGLREDRKTLLPGNGINALCIADFNNDGNLDIFVSNYSAGVVRDIDSYIYWGREGGRFSGADRFRMSTHSASGCIPGDFNEDGYIDLAIAYHKVNGNHASNSAVWWNGPAGFSERRVTELPTQGPHGMVMVNPGNQRDRGSDEYYVSAPYQLPADATVERIGWDGQIPPKTWVRVQLRFAPTREGLAKAIWQPADGKDWLENGEQPARLKQDGRWLQYRLALGAKDGGNTPRVSEVRVNYNKPGTP